MKDINLNLISAYYNTEFRDAKKHIQQQILNLEKDSDRDVRDSVFSAEKEKTESPSSDDISDDTPSVSQVGFVNASVSRVGMIESSPTEDHNQVTSKVEIVETPPAEEHKPEQTEDEY